MTKNFIHKRDCKLYTDMLNLIKFLNKDTDNVESGINKKLELEYNNSLKDSKMHKS